MRKLRIGARLALFGILAVLVLGLVVSGLWNALMPAIFGLPAITYWQALGLFILSRILFGRFGSRRWGRPRWGRDWRTLTPEERERIRGAMRSCRPHDFPEPGAPEQA